MSENTQEQSRAITPIQRFNKAITNQATQDYISQVIGNPRIMRSYVTNVIALVSNSTQLQECEPMSVIYAGLTATGLNLSLAQSLGESYVVPYKDKKRGVTIATFQIGAKGWYKLAVNTKQYKNITWGDIREGEIVGYDCDSGLHKVIRLENREKLPIIGHRAVFELNWGLKKEVYMTVAELKAHGQRYSQSYRSGYGQWVDDFPSACDKTVMKLLISRFGVKSSEIEEAITFDNAMIDKDKPIYVDNEKEPTEREIEIARQITEKFGNKIKVDDIPATNFEEVNTDSAQTENPELFKEPKK